MIALIDYGMGNLSSVYKAFIAVGARNLKIVSTPKEIIEADAVILPGVGNFGDGMKNLTEKGLDQAVRDTVSTGKPFFGICLGMQLLMESSEEAPGVSGLGVLKGRSIRFSKEMGLKIPQIGWNCVNLTREHPYFTGISSGEYFYFVHSYYLKPDDDNTVLGITDHGIDFCSCVAKNNIFATQFHPEKSQDAGLTVLKNFIKGNKLC
jgi:imidazole glycerol-phosphate synthase subunit HisH